ncbi:ankyrin repeat domain-containing protein 17 [Mytilus galloprovincialis]|uniref:Ankyrin repeat domain-containing protein 17 n=1 Tax=Mytilus galloprovincialis TaxID=29158 RepID=A0A8B6BL32_MYTGA|nr:ankyrin repeat domain-containing protein 17 [Mytilus galloprovincialis]
MANSSIVSTEEENFVRIFMLTNEISPKAIRKVFNREFNPNQLQQQLNVLYSKIMKLRNQHIINQSQYDMLYPLGGGPKSETFDISLMVTFLRHFTKISRPKKGFDQLPDKADTKEGDDLARIKFYRNQIAHKSETKMSTTQFSEVWSTVAAAAVRIGGSDYDIAQECNSLRFAVFASAHHEILLQLKLFRSQLTEIKMESIPQNIRRLHLIEIDKWRKEDENYVEIEASRYVYECIQSNPCMIIVGVSGAGKTATAHHVALYMQNHLDYVIVPIKSPSELEKYFSISKKQVFLVDDFCGRYTVIQNDINEWLKYMESTKSILKEFSVKLILTCRLQVFRESQFKHLTFLTQCLCNMSAEFVLSEEERKSIAKMYLPSEADKIPAMGCYDAFPLMCNLYSKNQQLLLKEFFTNPYEIYEREFQMLFDQSDKTKLCALVLIVLTNNHITETWVTECDNPFFNAMFENACDECCITPASSKRLIIEHLNSFLLTYLQKIGDIYTTKHDTIFDFLACFVGKMFSDCVLKYGNYSLINERCMLESINEECNEFSIIIHENKEKYYFDRLIYELKNGQLLSIFSSTQMNSDDYRRKLMTNLETKLATSFASLLDQEDKETGYSPLLFCCFAGYLDMVNFLVKSQVDVNKYCIKNYDISPLYIASQQGNLKIVQTLLKNGAEKNSYIENGSTPLYIASQQGHIDIVRLLLSHEADPNLSRENGCTPLHSACQEGHFDIVCLLLHNKADVNLCNAMNESALFLSCQEGHGEIVTFLLKNKALVNSSTKDKLSPLFIACNQGHLSIVELLLTFKADVNACSGGLSPLMISCQNEMYDIVKFLLMNKANVNFETTTQSTTLFDACELNSKKIVRLLLAYDAQVNHIRDDESTPLFIACCNGQSGIVRILLMQNADPTLCRNDTSPLYVACNNGFVKVVDILVHHESNCRMINKCTDDNTSPLFIACQEGFESIVALLLKNGADCNICRFNGISPLYVASELGYEKIVDMLLQAINSTSKSVDEFVFEETTPLFIASQNGHSKIVSKLIECSADVDYCRVQKNEETSPLFIACQEGHIRIVEDLINAKANTDT